MWAITSRKSMPTEGTGAKALRWELPGCTSVVRADWERERGEEVT